MAKTKFVVLTKGSGPKGPDFQSITAEEAIMGQELLVFKTGGKIVAEFVKVEIIGYIEKSAVPKPSSGDDLPMGE